MESSYSQMFIIYVEKHETLDKVPRNRYHRQRYSALRLTKIRNELINSLVWSCCPAKRIIYICTTSRFPCDVRLYPKLLSLMKERGTKELEQLKSLSLIIQEVISKSCDHREKKKKIC